MKKELQKINHFFETVFYFFHSHSRFTIGFSLLVFVLALFGSLNLKQAVTITDQMDPDAQSTKDIIYTNETFSKNSSLGLIVTKKDHSDFNSKELCQLQIKINEIVYDKNYVNDFNSPFKMRKASLNGSTLTYDRILPNPCEMNPNEIYSLKILNETPWRNLLSGEETKDIVYNFSFKPIETPTKLGHFDPNRVVDFMNTVEGSVPFRIFWTGPEAMQFYTVEGLNHSQWLNLLVIIIIWIGLKIYFGTIRAGAIYLGTLMFSVTIVFGGMGVLGHPIDMLSSCLFLLLAISSLQDFIFVAQHQLQSHDDYIQSHLKLITSSFFTSFTTILGFASLITSELISIRRFGFWAAVGALVEWIAVFWLIPAFMKVFPAWQKWVNKSKALSLEKVNEFTILRPPRLVSRLMLIFFVGAIFSVRNFRLSQTPSEMFPAQHPYQQMINYVRGNRGWEADASLVFKSTVGPGVKSRILHQIEVDPIVTKIENYDRVLNYIQSSVSDPQTRTLIKNELEISKFSERYINELKEERAFLFLKTTNTEKINLLRDKVKTLCPNRECYLTGEIIGFADFSKSLINTLFTSLFVSLILVTGTIWYLAYLFGSKNFFKMIISSFWGPAVLLCLIYIFDISVNFVTCIIASTLVGLTGDNAIQFLFASENDNLDAGIQKRGASSFYCSFTMALSSLVFLGSYFDAPKTLGVMLAVGFMLSYVGDVWLLKGLNNFTIEK
jgi:predicted RND superfamily exporter protein